jgi:hypothetical protein
VEGSAHQPQEANTEGGEDVKQFDYKVALWPHNVQGHKALAQIQLMGQNLLNVLLALHRKSLKHKIPLLLAHTFQFKNIIKCAQKLADTKELHDILY